MAKLTDTQKMEKRADDWRKYNAKTYTSHKVDVHAKPWRDREFKRIASEKKAENDSSFSIFRLVLIILLVSAVVAFLTGNPETKTFRGFLEMLQNVPDITSRLSDFWSLPIFSLDLPYWLSWLDGIFDFLGGLYVVLAYVVVGLGQALWYIVYFLRWLFV